MNTNTTSANPIVQAIVGGTAPESARLMAARGMLPLAQEELLEVLVALRADTVAEIAEAAGQTLDEQEPGTLLALAASPVAPPAALAYFAGRADAGRAVHEAVLLNARTPDEAVVALAAVTTDGSLLELITVNQQRLIRVPAILDAVLANPARTSEAERRRPTRPAPLFRGFVGAALERARARSAVAVEAAR